MRREKGFQSDDGRVGDWDDQRQMRTRTMMTINGIYTSDDDY